MQDWAYGLRGQGWFLDELGKFEDPENAGFNMRRMLFASGENDQGDIEYRYETRFH
jgi:hypothetical protein